MDAIGISMPLSDLIDPKGMMLIILGGLVLWAAVTDFRTYRIPNIICVLTAISGLAWQLVFSGNTGMALVIALGILCVGFALTLFNVLGAGDVKLFTALALWAGPEEILLTTVHTFMAGGGVALFWIMSQAVRSRMAFAGINMETVQPKNIPFGVPIAIGTGLMIFRIWPGA